MRKSERPSCERTCEAAQRDNCILTYQPAEPQPATTNNPPNKHVIAFLGLPGAGKTTQIDHLMRTTENTTKLHMSTFIKTQPNYDPITHQNAKAAAELIQGYDEAFLHTALTTPTNLIALDGYPRNLHQLQALQRTFHNDITFIILDLNHNPNSTDTATARQRSLHRQTSRDEAAGRVIDLGRYERKIHRAMHHEMPVIQKLHELGLRTFTFDALDAPEAIANAIRTAITPERSPQWPIHLLQALQASTNATDTIGWLTSGAVYRAYWNDVFGPMQEAIDADIITESESDAETLRKHLQHHYPTHRWSVLGWHEHAKEAYGIHTPRGFINDLGSRIVTYRQAAIRLVGDRVSIHTTPQAALDLRHGIIRIDAAALNALPEKHRDYHMNKTTGTIRKLLFEYPGLALTRETNTAFHAAHGRIHTPTVTGHSWTQVERSVINQERGGFARWSTEGWLDAEINHAKELVNFYLTADRKASAPPTPKQSVLPTAIEEVRNGTRDAHQVPQPYENWLHYAASEANDSEFREWLINQTRSRNPIAGKNVDLQNLLSFEAFDNDPRIRNMTGDQKATHDGWPLFMHLKTSALQLNTDDFIPTHDTESQKFIRLSLRLALLYHDVGKLLNVHTPGAHEQAGAKLFMKYKPEWVPHDVAQVVQYLISNHDLFGRLARGITEKQHSTINDPSFDVTSPTSYTGAIDPMTATNLIQEGANYLKNHHTTPLNLLETVWLADVASVAKLRWLLPAATIIKQILTIRHERTPNNQEPPKTASSTPA